MEQLIVTYTTKENLRSIVKIKLGKNFDYLEFDVFFSRLSPTPYGQDVTINWKTSSLVPSPNVFYTDANAFKIVRREMDLGKPYQLTSYNQMHQVASHFYPINSAIFIEDAQSKEQMVVMNDRPQAGSAYQSGRIELMIHRASNSNDDLGVNEPMREVTNDTKGINVSAKFYMAFTKNRDDAYKII